ncbi:hypothetical protein N7471_008659 [Penicillium samsonianum]|uniref:uncharacterized protein n=1 Tax=Penicillium samsonianum TaxID=1882272 RepID=UPI002549A60D|nr:uncharacterized protein N7471_008659 [Penicillium samsonianum]KAJ6133444.1 hypothetical protein N7471_008659 [Penicillium samsonianum]
MGDGELERLTQLRERRVQRAAALVRLLGKAWKTTYLRPREGNQTSAFNPPPHGGYYNTVTPNRCAKTQSEIITGHNAIKRWIITHYWQPPILIM